MPKDDDLDSILGELAAASAPADKASATEDFKDLLDEIDSLPVAVSILDDLVDYPTRTYPGEETVVISTRIPVSLMGQFEEFRDKIGSKMPKEIWKVNSDLLRWCIFDSFKKLRHIQELLDKGEEKLSPLLAAQLFLEQTGGKLVAHANTRNDAKEKAARTAEMLRDMMANREFPQAANVLIDWFEGARHMREISPYWESAMIKALIRTPDVPRIIVQLATDGHIVDPEILELYDGLIEQAEQQAQQEIDDLPVAVATDAEEQDVNPKRNRKGSTG